MQKKNPLESQIALIVTTLEEGSFTRAAKKLGMPQPSLTRRVALIEKAVGVRLFDRSSRKLELTKAGRLFVPDAIAAMNHAEQAWGLARHQALIEQGPFRVGYSAYIHSALFPMLKHKDVAKFEPANIVLESVSTMNMVRRILRGDLHAGIGVLPVEDEDLWMKVIAEEGFYLCLPKGHRLAFKSSVAAKDMQGESIFWIPRSVHPGLYDATTTYLQSLGIHVVFEEMRGAAHVIESVANGFGLGLVPRSATRLTRTGVIFKSLSDRYLRIGTALFARRDQSKDLLHVLADGLSSRLQKLKLET